MSFLLFENNFQTTFAAPVAPSDLTATLVSAAGLPSPGANEYFVLSFFDAATLLVTEIVWVTNVTGNVITMTRAKEGTTALAWLAGDKVSGQWTAGQAAAMQQTAQAQAQGANYAADTGAANAYVVAMTPPLTSHVIGMPIRVLWAHDNSGASTINTGPSAVSIRAPDGSVLQDGDILAGSIGTVIYDGTYYELTPVTATATRSGTVALPLGGFVPPGSGLLWFANSPPAGYLECNGASLSTSTYAALFAAIGYQFGGAGPNFTLPDLRGYFPRGWSHGSGVDSGRAFGSYQSDAFAAHTHNFNWYSDNSGGLGAGHGGTTPTAQATSSTGAASETRPVNLAIMYCVKY